VLPRVIAKLRERGFHFVTVSTLLGLNPAAPQAPVEAPNLQTASRPDPDRSRTQ
jgi:hypothetical protein